MSYFKKEYSDIECQMKHLADKNGDIYLPNPEPIKPVDYILICMEPSLGGWAHSKEEAKLKIDQGFRNFLAGFDPMLLHYSVRKYLCEGTQTYHITDFSKGAMLVDDAKINRAKRYEDWYKLLEEEVKLLEKPETKIIAVGKEVCRNLKLNKFPKPIETVIHYSPLAGRARSLRVAGYEDQFKDFKQNISHADVLAIAQEVIGNSGVPLQIKDDALSIIEKGKLTESRLKLLFSYKLEFEGMKFRW